MYLRYLPCIKKFGLLPSDEVNVPKVPSMYQEVWSATFLPVVWLIETSTTKNVFLWYRFQRDVRVHLSFEVLDDVHINRIPSKQFFYFYFFLPRFSSTVRDELTEVTKVEVGLTSVLFQLFHTDPVVEHTDQKWPCSSSDNDIIEWHGRCSTQYRILL